MSGFYLLIETNTKLVESLIYLFWVLLESLIDINSRPLAPEARIIPLDQTPVLEWDNLYLCFKLWSIFLLIIIVSFFFFEKIIIVSFKIWLMVDEVKNWNMSGFYLLIETNTKLVESLIYLFILSTTWKFDLHNLIPLCRPQN